MRVYGMILGVLGMVLSAACPAAAADGEQAAPVRHEIRIEMQAAGDGQEPRVRMWINGEEVEPGEAVEVGDGRAQVHVRAIPRIVAREVGEAEEEPRPRRGALGVRIGPLTDDLARETGVDAGVAVLGVIDGSPAGRAGLREGDVITHVDGRPVASPGELAEIVGGHRPGDRVRLRWQHRNARVESTVRLSDIEEMAAEAQDDRAPRDPERADREREEREEEARRREERQREQPERDERGAQRRRGGFLGILAAPLNDDIRDLAGTDEGVLINSLTDDSPAAKAGLRPGDVIVRIGDAEVHSVDELVEVLSKREPGQRVHVMYWRMGKRREAEVALGRRPGEAEREEARRRDGMPLFDIPEELFRGEGVPDLEGLRKYLERLRPEMQEWARRFRQRRLPQRDRPPEPEARPEEASPPAEREPYGVGKDIGRLMERLERIERRLDRIEQRLERIER